MSRPVSGPSWHEALSVGAEARGALSSDAALAGLVALDLERQVPHGVGWLFRLSALRSLESHVDDSFGRRAAFTWTAARVDAGPTLFDPGMKVSLEPALGIDVGAIEAKSESRATRPWASVLLQMRVRYRATARLQIELNAGAVAPIVRDRFTLLGPDAVIFREPALAGFTGLSLGLSLD